MRTGGNYGLTVNVPNIEQVLSDIWLDHDDLGYPGGGQFTIRTEATAWKEYLDSILRYRAGVTKTQVQRRYL